MVCSPFLPHVYEPAAGFIFRKCCDLAADPEKLYSFFIYMQIYGWKENNPQSFLNLQSLLLRTAQN